MVRDAAHEKWGKAEKRTVRRADEEIQATVSAEPTVAAGGGKAKKQYDIVILQAWCKSCGICVAFCPKKVIGTDEMGNPVVEHPEDCSGCRFCELHCPDFAIAVKERERYPQ